MSARFGAVVLAAGSARRFGGGKLAAVWRGKPLIASAAASALAATEGPVVVVVGDQADRVGGALPPDPRLQSVFAADHALGLAHSLRAGLAALPGHLDGAFVFLGDMPAIPPGIGAALAAALGHGAQAAAPAFEGRRGHPVLFARALFPQLMSLAGDRGATALLDGLGDLLVLVETAEAGVLFDVDTRADLEG